MRQCTAALTSYLGANQAVTIQDMYTFQLVGGGTIRYSGGTSQLATNTSFFPGSPLNGSGGSITFNLGPTFGRTNAKFKVGVEPQFIEITISPNPGDTIGNFGWANAARIGLFDGCHIEVNKYFFQAISPDNTLGAITWWYGQVSDIDIGRTHISMRVGNLMNLIKQRQIPRRIYQSSCNWVFGGPGCQYDRVLGKNALGAATGFGQQTITAGGGSGGSEIAGTGFAPTPSDIYNYGSVTGVTGLNAGYTRTISNVVSGNVFTSLPFFYTISAGDTFHVLPGCDHTTARCNTDFNNLLRYGGFPYIPPPEAAV